MANNNGKNKSTQGNASEIASAPALAPEKHAGLGAGAASGAFGKPEDITPEKQADLDALAAKTRASVGDASLNVPQPEIAKIDYVPNASEKHLFKLGIKSARKTAFESIFSVKTESIGKLATLGLFVGFKGLDIGHNDKSLVEINLATLASLIAALPTSTPRKAGESSKWVRQTTINAASVDQGDSANKIALVDVTSGVITMASGITLKHAALPVSAFGKTDVKNADKRSYYFCDVTYADNTCEVIKSFWLDGLLSAINARKQAIKADHFTSIEKYDVRTSTSA